jgi:hypothetical protein
MLQLRCLGKAKFVIATSQIVPLTGDMALHGFAA